jgi:hypothetical protein
VLSPWCWALSVRSAANPVKNDLVADRIVQILDNHPKLTRRFCDTLSVPALRTACLEAGLKTGRTKSALGTTNDRIANISKAAAQSSMDPDSEKVLREYLYSRFGASREVRRSVALRVMNTTDVQNLVDRALDDVAARIQANKPSVFETYDRIRSEGEFRRGVAVPLGVALSAACSMYTSNPWSIAAAGIPLLFVYFSGLRKQEESTKIVVSWVNAGIADIRLDIRNPRLLRWPTKITPEPSMLSKLRTYAREKHTSRQTAAIESESPVEPTVVTTPAEVPTELPAE